MAHETRTGKGAATTEGLGVNQLGLWIYLVVFLALPWLVIAVDALVLGLHFWVLITMLFLFSLGVVLGPAFFGGTE